MLALTLTLITAVYIFGPELLSRYILGWVVPRRAIQQTSSEEISRAILTAAVPLCLAVSWVTLRHVVAWDAITTDVHTYTAGIVSQKFFDEHTAQFFSAAKTVLTVFWAVAWRLYALLIIYAVIIDIVIYYYGEIRNSQWMAKHPRWRSVLAIFVLPRISVWHTLLKSVSHKKSVDIRVDIITSRDALYRGTIEDLLLTKDGELSGLLLTTPLRYQREKYLDDLKKYSERLTDQLPITQSKPHSDNYWKPIPGHAFLIRSDHIETINLRSYERDDQELLERLGQIFNMPLSTARRRSGTAAKTKSPQS